MKNLSRLISALFLLLITSCVNLDTKQIIAEIVIEPLSNAEISYNPARCPIIKNNCRDGNYKEWQQDNGQLACACNR